MRTIVVAAIVIASATAFAKPPPCPAGLEDKIAARYLDADEHIEPELVRISACVWGNFAGPGWFVFHRVQSDERGHPTLGGEVFVAKDGTIIATASDGGMNARRARVVDLDGDGIDEIVTTVEWQSSTSPDAGKLLSVHRVVGDTIETVFEQNIRYTWKRDSLDDFECIGKAALVVASRYPTGRTRSMHLVVAMHTSGNARHIADLCVRGTHEYRYTRANGMTEVK